MDTDGNKVTWVVIIVAAVAIMGGLFVKFVPNIDSQMQGYAQTVIGNFSGTDKSSGSGELSGTNVDASSNSDFSYSEPNTSDDTISIVGYSGHEENLIIPQYRKIGSVSYKITAISRYAFKGNTSIKQVTIPDGLRSIGTSAFDHASNLKYLTLGSDVTSIGNSAFQYTALTSVDFPASVKSVGMWAFQFTPISAISFKTRVALDSGSFRGTNLKNVTLPTGSRHNTDSFDRNVNVTIK